MKWQRTINILVVIALILVTGVQMRTGDMLEKIARGQRLSESDIATLRLKMNQQENMTSIWSGNTQGTEPAFTGRPEDTYDISDHPATKVYSVATQSIPNAAYTKMEFDSIQVPEGISVGWKVDLSASATDITVPETGIYFVCAEAPFSSNATGFREIRIDDNSSGTTTSQTTSQAVTGGGVRSIATSMLYLDKGSVVYVYLWQNSGGNLDITYRALSMFRIRGVQQK